MEYANTLTAMMHAYKYTISTRGLVLKLKGSHVEKTEIEADSYVNMT